MNQCLELAKLPVIKDIAIERFHIQQSLSRLALQRTGQLKVKIQCLDPETPLDHDIIPFTPITRHNIVLTQNSRRRLVTRPTIKREIVQYLIFTLVVHKPLGTEL